MSLTAVVIVCVVLMVGLIGLLALVMTRPTRLTPHRSPRLFAALRERRRARRSRPPTG